MHNSGFVKYANVLNTQQKLGSRLFSAPIADKMIEYYTSQEACQGHLKRLSDVVNYNISPIHCNHLGKPFNSQTSSKNNKNRIRQLFWGKIFIKLDQIHLLPRFRANITE